jgi:hypothetical protein
VGGQGVVRSDLLEQFDGAADNGADFSERFEERSATLIGVSGEVNCDVFTNRFARREEMAGCKSV